MPVASTRFLDRHDAGRQLADRLAPLGLHQPVVLGLPRGGVPVAAEIAKRLGAEVEVFVARKVGAPGQPELGIGAVAEGSELLVVTETALQLGIDDDQMDRLAMQSRAELERRVTAYRGDRALPALGGRDVIVVDDGLATGVTAQAALLALRAHEPSRLILAVPACPSGSAERMAEFADEVVWLIAPDRFYAVGEWYDDFRQVTDAEVADLLSGRASPPDDAGGRTIPT